jgi:hypothetical protein
MSVGNARGLNRFPPPPLGFFTGLAPRGSAPPLAVNIGGWDYRLSQSDPVLRAALETRYRPYLVGSPSEDCLSVELRDGQCDHFVPPEAEFSPGPHPLSLAWEDGVLLVRSYGFAGWASLENSRGGMALARGNFERPEWCVENYLRVLTAWRAARGGGVLLHAASLVRGERAYLFLGPSGSGKSTLAARSREGVVLSDDLTLIRREEDRYRVWATPFRGTYTGGPPQTGSYPIGGLYRIFKDETERLEKVPRANAVADLLAASPFVVDQIDRDGRILQNLRALEAAYPVSYLYFTIEGDIWKVLDRS